MAHPGPRYRSAVINLTAAGDNLIVSNPSMPINVYGLQLVSAAPVNVVFKSGTGNPLSGPMNLVAGGSITLPTGENCWYVCGAGSGVNGGFVINLDAAAAVGGTVYYTFGGV